MSLYGLFADIKTAREHLAYLGGFLPDGVLTFVGDEMVATIRQRYLRSKPYQRDARQPAAPSTYEARAEQPLQIAHDRIEHGFRVSEGSGD